MHFILVPLMAWHAACIVVYTYHGAKVPYDGMVPYIPIKVPFDDILVRTQTRNQHGKRTYKDVNRILDDVEIGEFNYITALYLIEFVS